MKIVSYFGEQSCTEVLINYCYYLLFRLTLSYVRNKRSLSLTNISLLSKEPPLKMSEESSLMLQLNWDMRWE